MIKLRQPSVSPRAFFLSESRRERLLGALALTVLFYMIAWHLQGSFSTSLSSRVLSPSPVSPSCAILLFGLPPAFPVVWPALRRHVILPNAAYGCDYYLHTLEESSASLTDRAVETMQQYFENELPRDPATLHLSRPAAIHVSTSNDAEFRTQHAALLHRADTVKDEKGRSTYDPWNLEPNEKSTFTDTTDIFKMWYAIQKVWQSMEEHQQSWRPYSRVAVLRWDMVYMTPVDIYQTGINPMRRDVGNTHIVLPGFQKHPINDRGIIGPAAAVRVWATERFKHVDAYVQEYRFKRPGSGVHSERYMGQFLLPRIQNSFPRFEFVERSDWCFYRAHKADHSVWISDCSLPAHPRRDEAVGYVTGCTCSKVSSRLEDVKEILCCLNETAVAQ